MLRELNIIFRKFEFMENRMNIDCDLILPPVSRTEKKATQIKKQLIPLRILFIIRLVWVVN